MCFLGVMTFDLLSGLHLSAKLAVFYINIADIWQTVLYSWTFKQNVRFQLQKIQYDRLLAII